MQIALSPIARPRLPAASSKTSNTRAASTGSGTSRFLAFFPRISVTSTA
ncbi:MAG: hypothetical protein NBV67_08140 [Tagaea sp.]|nr:hypothetical protein [Tagaea sp.]